MKRTKTYLEWRPGLETGAATFYLFGQLLANILLKVARRIARASRFHLESWDSIATVRFRFDPVTGRVVSMPRLPF